MRWTEEAGDSPLVSLRPRQPSTILEEPGEIVASHPLRRPTRRAHCTIEQPTLSEIRAQDREAHQEHLPQAACRPRSGVKPILKAWMELN